MTNAAQTKQAHDELQGAFYAGIRKGLMLSLVRMRPYHR